MRGVLDPHLAVGRYKEFELRNTRKLVRLPGSPTGLGTSAARIASLLRGIQPGVEVSEKSVEKGA
jgi:germacradienol/geosmin synthase